MHTSSSARRRVTALVTALLAGSVLATPAVVALSSAGGTSEGSVVVAGITSDGGRRGHTWDRVLQYPAP